jgi:DNA-binding PadR family transcriptional regulator
MSMDSLTAERRRVLNALARDSLSSSAIARRLRALGTGGDTETLLFPALHGLEASGRLQARWAPNANGISRRTYRKRRLLPRRLGG